MAKKPTAAKKTKAAAKKPAVPAYEKAHTATFIGQQYKLKQDHPMVIYWPRAMTHQHTYGLLSPFFEGLTKGKLMATKCTNKACEENRLWLPPRAHCPDCYNLMKWQEIKGPVIGKIYTYTLVDYAGVGIELTTPYWQIDVELPGLATVFKGYLASGKPKIGDRVVARFRTGKEATNSILDIYWELYQEPAAKPAAKKAVAKKPAAKKAVAKKPAAKKASAKKPAAKKAVAQKAVTKKPAAKKAPAKKPAAKKPAAK